MIFRKYTITNFTRADPEIRVLPVPVNRVYGQLAAAPHTVPMLQEPSLLPVTVDTLQSDSRFHPLVVCAVATDALLSELGFQ